MLGVSYFFAYLTELKFKVSNFQSPMKATTVQSNNQRFHKRYMGYCNRCFHPPEQYRCCQVMTFIQTSTVVGRVESGWHEMDPSVSSGFQNQTGLSPVLRAPGRYGHLAV